MWLTFFLKVSLSIACPDALVDLAIEKICEAARTGKIGDGKIFCHTARRKHSH